MIYCSGKYCCSNSSIPGVILHSIMKSIKTPNHPTYHWSALWPLEVRVRGLYNSLHYFAYISYLCLFIYLWKSQMEIISVFKKQKHEYLIHTCDKAFKGTVVNLTSHSVNWNYIYSSFKGSWIMNMLKKNMIQLWF